MECEGLIRRLPTVYRLTKLAVRFAKGMVSCLALKFSIFSNFQKCHFYNIRDSKIILGTIHILTFN